MRSPTRLPGPPLLRPPEPADGARPPAGAPAPGSRRRARRAPARSARRTRRGGRPGRRPKAPRRRRAAPSPTSSSTAPAVRGSHRSSSAAYTRSSTSRTRSAPCTTITAPVWLPPATTRCPVPASFRAPAAFTLHRPGQYSPGTSPTRPSTPSSRRARAISVAVASKRSWMPGFGSGSGTAWASSSVPSWKTAARPPASRRIAPKPEARAAASAGPYPGDSASRFANATTAAGRARRKRLGQRALRHAVHHGARHRGVERRIVRKGVVEDAQGRTLRDYAAPLSSRERTWPLRSSARASRAARRSSSSGRSPRRRAR